MSTQDITNGPADLSQSRFLKACRGEQTDATPVWLMRQAGRYMTEYRELRKKYTILELIKDPALATEVTMQPIQAFDLDAAIIFADILPPLEGMGLQLEFQKGEGPVIHNPVRTEADVRALRQPDPEEFLHFTLDAIRMTRKELDPRGVPLIGFSGAPFTLASYAVEGGSSRNRVLVKSMMMNRPDLWDIMMTKLAKLAGDYLVAQAKAGAQVLVDSAYFFKLAVLYIDCLCIFEVIRTQGEQGGLQGNNRCHQHAHGGQYHQYQ